ncbi:hypothetical protein DNTS_016291 [Danionella cerebrum]|uniref:non-specific serine/threonine protein kinase n=1 Tax=Danionella cerebrum TaxID=2873325 RepID=A0A553RKA6_9TELE|nr:hypothetical protein DNTS_016291 [Danionella translucida]
MAPPESARRRQNGRWKRFKKAFLGLFKCFGSPESEADINNNTVETSSAEVVDEVSPAPAPKEVTSEQIRAVLEDLGPSSSLVSEDNSSTTSFCSDASLSSLQLREDNALHIELKERRYAIGKKLNEGDFVSIFKAIRMQDGTRVALKVSNKADTKYYRMEGHSEPVPLEVKLLTLANVEPRIPQVVELLDWHQDGDQYTMELIRLLSFNSLDNTMEDQLQRGHSGLLCLRCCVGESPESKILRNWIRMFGAKMASQKCCRLLCSLLRRDPRKRLHMLKVCSHNWFKALYYKQDEPKIIEINSIKYKIQLKIGNGGFGSIFKAVRMSDGKKVALKFADRSDIDYISVEGHSEPYPSEVVLQIFANRGPKVSQILKLLDWEMKSDHYVMVLEEFIPPEFKEHGEYYGKPATVWSLGILMFCLVTGEFPSTRDLERLDDNSWTHHSSSAECCKLVCSLLQRDPERRCELEDISGHAWFNSGIIPTGI